MYLTIPGVHLAVFVAGPSEPVVVTKVVKLFLLRLFNAWLTLSRYGHSRE